MLNSNLSFGISGNEVITKEISSADADVAIEDVKSFEAALFEHLAIAKDELLATIRDTGKLEPETEADLREAILEFKAKFNA